MKITTTIAAMFLILGLTACSTISSWVTSVETVMSGSNVTANALVYCASEMYTIAANVTTTAVSNGAFTNDQLTQLNTYRAAVRSALDNMKTSLDAGDTVEASAFTTAWAAFKTYLGTLGISLTAQLYGGTVQQYATAKDAHDAVGGAFTADQRLMFAIKTARAAK